MGSCSLSSVWVPQMEQCVELGSAGEHVYAPQEDLQFTDILSDQYRCSIEHVRIGRHTGVSYFKITVEQRGVGSWVIEKRYSDFEHLRNQLSGEGIRVPDFPRKRVFSSYKEDAVADRQQRLTLFLNSVALGATHMACVSTFLELKRARPLSVAEKIKAGRVTLDCEKQQDSSATKADLAI